MPRDANERVSLFSLSRQYYRWCRDFRRPAELGRECAPWMPFSAIDFIQGKLTKEQSIFEFGAGQSTLYFARRIKNVVTVEHDQAWAERVRNKAAHDRLQNISIIVAPPSKEEQASHRDPADLDSYVSSDRALSNYSFREYASAIDRFDDASFDFIIIDGRARPSCMKHAVNKLAPGGWLVLDNAERPHYRAIHQALLSWDKRTFIGPGAFNHYFWKTCFWRRVKGD